LSRFVSRSDGVGTRAIGDTQTYRATLNRATSTIGTLQDFLDLQLQQVGSRPGIVSDIFTFKRFLRRRIYVRVN